MDSLRDSAACIGLSGTFSVLKDYFGFTKGRFDSPPTERGLPPDPTGATVQVSLLRQIELLEGDHFDINIVRIGEDDFSNDDYIELDYTVFKIRNIYNQKQVGIGKVEWYYVLSADADGLDEPDTKAELREISRHWSVDNDAIDVFIPFNMNVPSDGGSILGLSAINGPCNKDINTRKTGAVAGLWGSEQTARTFSHEVGHYLGLYHRNGDPQNLMCQSSKASSTRNSTNLTDNQGDNIKNHCFMNGSC
jgi:hypothetical protein